MIQDDDRLYQLLDEVTSSVEAKRLRLENPWVLDLIKVLWPYSKFGLRRVDVIDRIRQLRIPKELPIPNRFEETIQSAFNRYSQDSLVFRKRGAPADEALFFSPKGKRSGVWAVHRERAEAWLRKKALPAA